MGSDVFYSLLFHLKGGLSHKYNVFVFKVLVDVIRPPVKGGVYIVTGERMGATEESDGSNALVGFHPHYWVAVYTCDHMCTCVFMYARVHVCAYVWMCVCLVCVCAGAGMKVRQVRQ